VTTDQLPGSPWQAATVTEIRPETTTAKTFRLSLTTPTSRLAGQYYVVRLTAPDGYTASRSYSVSSGPNDSDNIEITVERLEGGEVSVFLHDEVIVGDELEVRGPIGLWFVWTAETPAVLVGGGSGIVPLMAMLRLARQSGRSDLVRMAVSVRTPDDLYYAHELPGPETTVAYTRVVPPSDPRPANRLSEEDLAPLLLADATAFVCGSPGFADFASGLLLALGQPVERIRVERFGPSG
jgi:ferredoxin-NADP reductase